MRVGLEQFLKVIQEKWGVWHQSFYLTPNCFPGMILIEGNRLFSFSVFPIIWPGNLREIPVKRFQQYFHWFPGFVHLNDWLSLSNIVSTTVLCHEPVWLTVRILPNPFTLLNCRFGSSSYLVVHISLVYISLPNISGNDDLDCSGFTQRHVFGYIVLQNAQNYRKNLPFLLKLEIYFVIRYI